MKKNGDKYVLKVLIFTTLSLLRIGKIVIRKHYRKFHLFSNQIDAFQIKTKSDWIQEYIKKVNQILIAIDKFKYLKIYKCSFL